MTTYSRPYDNLGYALHKFTEEELAPIWAEINSIMADPTGVHTMNHELAGNIEKEFALTSTHDYIERLISPLVWQYNNDFNYPNSLEVVAASKPLKLDRPWVNIMKKHEFNPMHNHSGVMSFVIWMKVPYTLASEFEAAPHVPRGTNLAGQFALHYVDTMGQIKSHGIPADNEFEGVVCLFPSMMNHSVYPFYSSDDYRISVAGNLVFDLDHKGDEDNNKYNTGAAWVDNEPSAHVLSSEASAQKIFVATK